MKTVSRRAMLGMVAASAIGLTACGEVTTTGEHVTAALSGTNDRGLPRTTVWTTYPIGTSVYAEQASVAEVLISDFDCQVRMIGSNTSMGRVAPIRVGQAQLGRLSDEAFYAFEGKYEFVTPEWGPQDLRTLWTPPTTVSLCATEESSIRAVADLKGKRVPWMTSSPSALEKVLGILSYAGLTPDDVKKVPVSYTAQPELMKNGGLDVVLFGADSPNLVEVATEMPLRWVDFEGDAEAEKRLQKNAPSVKITDFVSPIGMDGRDVCQGPNYAIQMTTYADYSADEVHAIVKAFHDAFPKYEKSVSTNRFWRLEDIDWMPLVLPHHDGLVRYLTELNIWTPAMEERNRLLVERGEALRAGWPGALEGTDPADLQKVWDQWKTENAPHPVMEA